MLRVLHMIGSLELGGSQSMVMNIYRNIDREQIQFDFIVDHPDRMYFADEVIKLGGKIFILPTFIGSNVLEVGKKWNEFFRNHKEYKILHSHVRSYASLYLPIAKKHGVKTIIHSHSTSNGKGIKALIKKIMQYPIRYQADYFFGCSKEAGKWLFGERIVKGNNYYTVKNAIDTRRYQLKSDIRAKYRKELNISDSKVVFMHVGRLHEAKNHKFLLEIFREIRQYISNSVLVIVGDGELKQSVENWIREFHLEKYVQMLGARKDVPKLLQAADCFLFPSIWEGLPVTVVEAQAAGLPCFISGMITQDVGISELVVYIPIDQGTYPWVEAVCNSDLKRKNVIEQIKKSGFDIKNMAEWLTDFYEGVCK